MELVWLWRCKLLVLWWRQGIFRIHMKREFLGRVNIRQVFKETMSRGDAAVCWHFLAMIYLVLQILCHSDNWKFRNCPIVYVTRHLCSDCVGLWGVTKVVVSCISPRTRPATWASPPMWGRIPWHQTWAQATRSTGALIISVHSGAPERSSKGYGELISSPVCRRCGAEEETAHILCECEALVSLWCTYVGSFLLDPEDIKCRRLGAIWNFSKGTGLPWSFMRYRAQRVHLKT